MSEKTSEKTVADALHQASGKHDSPPAGNGDAQEVRDPFELLASEFADRCRRGESPSVEQYAERNPELAGEIRELFPTIAAMEQLKEGKQKTSSSKALGHLQIEQLGDFRIIGEIGRGGMGVVYEAEQISLGRHVAVKVLPKQLLLDERHLKRFQREAQTAAKLHHTNIVPVFGAGEQDGYHYIVMQFIHGVGLDEVMLALRRITLGNADRESADLGSNSARVSHANLNAQALLEGEFGKRGEISFSTTRGSSSSLSVQSDLTEVGARELAPTEVIDGGSETVADPDEEHPEEEEASPAPLRLSARYWNSVARIGVQVADALQYAHEQGTLHRDVKPGNLLLDGSGTVWVADFGLAKFAEHDNVSRSGDVVGTLAYMPPETFDGQADARSDTYSLGLTLYEMLTLRPAYDGRDRGKLVHRITQGDLAPPRKYNPHIPRDLETIVLKAVAHDPADRYPTAGEFAEDLHRFLDDRPILARRTSAPERLWRWCRRNRLVAALAATALLLLILVAGVSSVGFFIVNSSLASEAMERQRAEDEKDRAEEMFNTALSALGDIYDRLAPSRLPVSSGAALQDAQEDADATDNEESTETEVIVQVTAPPPVSAETAVLLQDLLKFYDKLREQGGDDTKVALKYADAQRRIGELHYRLGKTKEAKEAFLQAIDKYKVLIDSVPSTEVIIGLAASYNELGGVQRWQPPEDPYTEGEASEKEDDPHQQALALLRSHPDILEESSPAKYELARTLFMMSTSPPPWADRGERRERGGERGGDGRPPGMREGPGRGERRGGPGRRGDGSFPGRGPGRQANHQYVQEAIDLLEQIKDEPFAEYRYLLARCYLGPWGGPRDEESKDNSQKAIEILEELVRKHANVPDYRYELAVAYLRSGLRSFGMDSNSRTDQLFRKAVNILEPLAAEHEDVAEYSRQLVFAGHQLCGTLMRQSDALRRKGDTVAAQGKLTAAITAYSRLAKARTRFLQQFPDQPPPFRMMLLGAGFDHAEALAEAGELDQAIAIHDDLIRQIETDLETAERPIWLKVFLLKTRVGKGKLLAQYGDHQQARSLCSSCQAEIVQLLAGLGEGREDQRERGELMQLFVDASLEATRALAEGGNAERALTEYDALLAQIDHYIPPDEDSSLNALAKLRVQFDNAKQLAASNQSEQANRIFAKCETELRQLMRQRRRGGRGGFRNRFDVVRLLADVLDELGKPDQATKLREEQGQSRFGGGPPGRELPPESPGEPPRRPPPGEGRPNL